MFLNAHLKLSVFVDENDTLRDVKEKIEVQVGIPANQQRIVYSKQEHLEDGKTLSDYQIIRIKLS